MLEYIMCVIHILPILFTVFIFQTSSTSGQVSMWYVLTLYHNTVSTYVYSQVVVQLKVL